MLLRVAYRGLFWLAIILLSIVPLALSRHGVELYLLPQFELAYNYFAAIALPIYSWQIFIYGVFIDALYGNPIGMSSTLMLVVFTLIGRWRNYLAHQDFSSQMLGFALLTIIYSVMKHLSMSFLYHQDYSYIITLINCGVTIGVYPLLYLCLARLAWLYHYE